MPAFQRNEYQSVTAKLTDASAFESLEAAHRRRSAAAAQRARREQDYYAEQSQAMTTVIRVFGTFVTLILSIGAMFGAMNTMYAAVAYRTREIGTLRALGFSRLRIVAAFLAESVALALVGGIIGCVLALPGPRAVDRHDQHGELQRSGVQVSHHARRCSPAACVFAALMGAVGGLLPALRAARIPVARALREI